MSRLDQLVAELCPKGAEFRALESLGRWYGGGTPSKHRREYWREGTIHWLSPKDMGRPQIAATGDRITASALAASAAKLIPPHSVAVVVRSSILDQYWPTALVTVPVTLNQDMRALECAPDLLPSYVAHLFRSIGSDVLRAARRTGGSVASLETSKLMRFRVPVPPLEVQREIVRVLDTFSELEAELEAELGAELEARRRQYEYYRDSLLARSGESSLKLMGAVGGFVRGRRFTKADVVPEGLPSIHYGEIYTSYGISAKEAQSHVRSDLAPSLRFAEPGDVVIAAVGETVEDVAKGVAWLGDQAVAIHDDCFAFQHEMNPKFVAYCLQTSAFHGQKAKYVARAKVKRISSEGLAKIQIPVPPRGDQDQIVAILDSFDVLVNDLSMGLPAELTARRKQYEYYRDELLTFKELAA